MDVMKQQLQLVGGGTRTETLFLPPDWEVEIRPCSLVQDVECDCKEEYYNASQGGTRDCQPCGSKNNNRRESHTGLSCLIRTL